MTPRPATFRTYDTALRAGKFEISAASAGLRRPLSVGIRIPPCKQACAAGSKSDKPFAAILRIR
jgi:hypothetical protein